MNSSNVATPFASTQAILGTWHGEVTIGATPVAIVVHVAATAGGLTATADFPQHHRSGVALRDVRCDGGTLQFGTSSMGDYTGTLAADGARIVGAFARGEQRWPLTLAAGAPQRAMPRRPQLPQPPFPYSTDDVVVENTADGVRLAGMYTRPTAAAPRAAVLLVTGSGAMDRDETVFGHKPFLVLADHLTRHGYAVLRLDDRGVGASSGDRSTLTIDDEAEDMACAMHWLAARPELAGVPVGVLGHSMGALTAAMVGVRLPQTAFVIALAGAGMDLAHTFAERECRMWKTKGVDDAALQRHRAYTLALYADLRDRAVDDPVDVAHVVALAERHGATATAVAKDAADWIARYNERWFRSVLAPDPATWLRRLRAPYLALTGEKDQQVTPEANLRAMQDALAGAAHPDYTLRELAGLNHLLQVCATGAPYEYPAIEETFAPAALEAIVAWLAARCAPRG